MGKKGLKRVLVVDPDKDFCKNVRLYLEDSYNVTTSQSFDYLNHTILLHKIDLLVIGADFAAQNLLELLNDLKANYSDLKIIIMYNYLPTDKKIGMALLNDADDTIAKPFDVNLLKEKVDVLLA